MCPESRWSCSVSGFQEDEFNISGKERVDSKATNPTNHLTEASGMGLKLTQESNEHI